MRPVALRWFLDRSPSALIKPIMLNCAQLGHISTYLFSLFHFFKVGAPLYTLCLFSALGKTILTALTTADPRCRTYLNKGSLKLYFARVQGRQMKAPSIPRPSSSRMLCWSQPEGGARIHIVYWTPSNVMDIETELKVLSVMLCLLNIGARSSALCAQLPTLLCWLTSRWAHWNRTTGFRCFLMNWIFIHDVRF